MKTKSRGLVLLVLTLTIPVIGMAIAIGLAPGGSTHETKITEIAGSRPLEPPTIPTTTTSTSTTVPTPQPPIITTTTARRSIPTQSTATSTTQPRSGGGLGRFYATCYGAFEGFGGNTASGKQSGPGSIAVDPSVIPMGTHLSIEGYGAGVADDVGGAIKGHRIDVWFRTASECSAWGARWVEVSRS